MTSITPESLLVIGGCSPLGSQFIRHAIEVWPNAKIVSLDTLTGRNSNYQIALELGQKGRREFITGDICNEKLLHTILTDHKVDTIVNLAQKSHTDGSYDDIFGDLHVNLQGVLSLVETLRHFPDVKKVVQLSHENVYGDRKDDSTPATERVRLSPSSPFASTKASGDLYCHAYHVSYKEPITVVRLGNTCGAIDTDGDDVVEKFTKIAFDNYQHGKNSPYPVYGDGLHSRAWLSPADAVLALRLALEKGTPGQVYNVAGDTLVTGRQVAETVNLAVAKLFGKTPLDVKLSKPTGRPYDDSKRLSDCSKAAKELGWHKSPYKFADLVDEFLQHRQKERTVVKVSKVMIFGSRGWLGGLFKEMFEAEKIPFYEAQTRPGDDEDSLVEQEILRICPSHILCTIGRTHGPGTPNIDYLEGGPDKVELNLRDNLYGPWLLAHFSTKFRIHLSYVGSGCLFKYDKEHPIGGKGFTEDDLPNYFGSSYSVVKGFTDRIMHRFDKSVLNLRLRLPVSFDDSPRNLIMKISQYKIISDIPNSASILPTLLPVLLRLMKQRYTGTLNFVNPDPVVHSLTLTAFKALINPKMEWTCLKETDPEAPKLLGTRSNCALDPSKLVHLAPELPSGKVAIITAVEEIAKKVHKKSA